jgi:hypothetical protein
LNGFSKPEVGNGANSENDGEKVEESEFWKQPDGLGYKPCLVFSRDYKRASEGIVKDMRKYLMLVVSGGMNQQRNQVVDAVVIATHSWGLLWLFPFWPTQTQPWVWP